MLKHSLQRVEHPLERPPAQMFGKSTRYSSGGTLTPTSQKNPKASHPRALHPSFWVPPLRHSYRPEVQSYISGSFRLLSSVHLEETVQTGLPSNAGLSWVLSETSHHKCMRTYFSSNMEISCYLCPFPYTGYIRKTSSIADQSSHLKPRSLFDARCKHGPLHPSGTWVLNAQSGARPTTHRASMMT